MRQTDIVLLLLSNPDFSLNWIVALGLSMCMLNLTSLRRSVISMLNAGLSPSLTYHNTKHTFDVERPCSIIAKEEGITSENELLELHVAALYHDTGFFTYL